MHVKNIKCKLSMGSYPINLPSIFILIRSISFLLLFIVNFFFWLAFKFKRFGKFKLLKLMIQQLLPGRRASPAPANKYRHGNI